MSTVIIIHIVSTAMAVSIVITEVAASTAGCLRAALTAERSTYEQEKSETVLSANSERQNVSGVQKQFLASPSHVITEFFKLKW